MRNIKMSWISPKIKVSLSSICGKGVFSQKEIKKDEILVIFGGYVMNTEEFFSLSEELQNFPYHISENLLFGPIKEEDVAVGEYFNHSCDPNAGFEDKITLVAMRDIKKGEEVTFDYAICMTSGILNMNCLCGKNNCRKLITGDDWKIEELQKKYAGYFQPYIQEKIDNKK